MPLHAGRRVHRARTVESGCVEFLAGGAVCAKAGGVTQPWHLGSWWWEVRPRGVGTRLQTLGVLLGAAWDPGRGHTVPQIR